MMLAGGPNGNHGQRPRLRQGARRNLDAIDSHLGRWLQDARHYEPPGLELFDASSACRGWCLLFGLLLASCRCHGPVKRLRHIAH